MRTTPKHLRPRWRYLGVGLETWPDVDLNRSAFQSALWESCRTLSGDVGGADADLTVYDFFFQHGRGEAVVKTHRGEVQLARAALGTISSVAGNPIRVRVRGVSGTVRGCEEKYLGRHRERIGETTVTVDGVERTGYRRGVAIDLQSEDTFVGATMLDIQ